MPATDEYQDEYTELTPSDSANETPMDAEQLPETVVAEVSAPSPEQGEPEDLLSVVRDVVANRGEKPTVAASPAAGEETVETEDEKAAAAAKNEDEDYSTVPFNKHPRFQQLLKQRNEFKVDAVRYQNVQKFMTEHNLGAEETASGLSIMGLAKTNPQEALKQLQPFLETLLVAAGEVLPNDLQARVDKGEITHAVAVELSRSGAQLRAHQTQQTFAQQKREREDADNHVASLRGAAQAWQADRVRLDPNFAAKLTPIMKEVGWLQKTEGVPNTPEGVKEQLVKAYKTVNASLAPAVAAPAPKPAITPVIGGQVNGNARPAPASILDIVRNRG